MGIDSHTELSPRRSPFDGLKNFEAARNLPHVVVRPPGRKWDKFRAASMTRTAGKRARRGNGNRLPYGIVAAAQPVCESQKFRSGPKLAPRGRTTSGAKWDKFRSASMTRTTGKRARRGYGYRLPYRIAAAAKPVCGSQKFRIGPKRAPLGRTTSGEKLDKFLAASMTRIAGKRARRGYGNMLPYRIAAAAKPVCGSQKFR